MKIDEITKLASKFQNIQIPKIPEPMNLSEVKIIDKPSRVEIRENLDYYSYRKFGPQSDSELQDIKKWL